MCLILFGYNYHPDYRLVMAANRDEFLARPTASLGYNYPGEDILAGRDLEGGGTWLGVTGTGRMAAITNYRDPARTRPHAPTRGDIVLGFLRSDSSAQAYLKECAGGWHGYNGFNLLLADDEGLWYHSNINGRTEQLQAGLYGISNKFLDTPWPKIERGKRLLQEAIANGCKTEDLFSVIGDRHLPEDHKLPDTGVGLAWERLLAPIFIHSPSYGTRSSAVLFWGHDGTVQFAEKGWQHTDRPKPEPVVEFSLQVP